MICEVFEEFICSFFVQNRNISSNWSLKRKMDLSPSKGNVLNFGEAVQIQSIH